jgi:hypothetical protein
VGVSANEADIAKEAVPSKLPVKEAAVTDVFTVNKLREASEPDTISFFQLGIDT